MEATKIKEGRLEKRKGRESGRKPKGKKTKINRDGSVEGKLKRKGTKKKEMKMKPSKKGIKQTKDEKEGTEERRQSEIDPDEKNCIYIKRK